MREVATLFNCVHPYSRVIAAPWGTRLPSLQASLSPVLPAAI